MKQLFEKAIVVRENLKHSYSIGDEIHLIDLYEGHDKYFTYVFIRMSDRLICELDESDFSYIIKEGEIIDRRQEVHKKFEW